MNYKKIGRSGLSTSMLSIGGWRNFGERLGAQETQQIIHSAAARGITTFDTADVYGNAEQAMGQAFKGLDRNKLVISSKCYWPMSDDINDRGLSRKHIRASVHRSLQHLDTDYIDIYLCHRFDETTPLRETIRAFDDLIREGKILYWGTSDWSAAQLVEAYRICEQMHYEPPILEQAEYSLLVRSRVEQELQPIQAEYGLGLMCWSPLAAGLLAGKNLDDSLQPNSLLASYSPSLRDKYRTVAHLEKARQLRTLAQQLDIPMAAMSLAWLAQTPQVDSIVVGVSSHEQLMENIAALDHTLSADTINQLNRLFASN